MAADRGRAVFGAGVHIFISRFITLRTSAGPFIWFALLAANFRDFFGIWLWIVLWGFSPINGKMPFFSNCFFLKDEMENISQLSVSYIQCAQLNTSTGSQNVQVLYSNPINQLRYRWTVL